MFQIQFMCTKIQLKDHSKDRAPNVAPHQFAFKVPLSYSMLPYHAYYYLQ